MAQELAGRVALVTGAGRGIGAAIARRLAAAGASVVVNDVDEDSAQELVAEIGAATTAPGSVTDPVATDAMVAIARREFGTLDIVVNNAGVTRDASLGYMTDDQWDLVINVVLRGTFNVCRSAASVLRRKDCPYHRKVVNISSVAGVYGAALNANYAAAKAGVIGLTKSLAREWAPRGVNVNAVAPGYIAGTFLTRVRSEGDLTGMSEDVIERLNRAVPIGRPGTPEDVAAAVAWLSGPGSDYTTGQVLEIHGGLEIVSTA